VAAPRLPELDTSAILDATRSLVPLLRERSDAIEAARRMPDDVLQALIDAGVFRVAMPRAWGGPEMDPISQIELIETLATGDASAAWVTMILSDSGFYGARLGEEVARKVFPSLDCRVAGQLYPAGQAVKVDRGYRVSGRWSFGSGCLHATAFSAGCLVFEDGKPVLGTNGLPHWRIPLLRPEDVDIHDTWHTTGLAGTSSNDYEVRDVFVPEERVFDLYSPPPRDEPLYRYHGMFFANLPGVPLGIGRAAIDEVIRIANEKRVMPQGTLMRDEYRVQEAVGEAEAMLGSARAYTMESMGDLWKTLCAGDEPSMAQRSRIGLTLVHSIQTGLKVVQLMASTAGSDAIFKRKSRLDRLLRDMTTASAHVLGQRRTYSTVGLVLLGGESPMTFF
jgi:alkylation response protein AidB-like acyl-CoA dehydrogenase